VLFLRFPLSSGGNPPASSYDCVALRHANHVNVGCPAGASEGRRTPRRWRVGQWLPNCAERHGLRQPSGALERGAEFGSTTGSDGNTAPHCDAINMFRGPVDKGAISGPRFQPLNKVMELCNAAIHGEPVTKEEADSILDTMKFLADDSIAWLSWGFPKK